MSAEAAVRALGQIAPRLSEAEHAPLIETLIKAMKDEYSDVRLAAVRALGPIAPLLSDAEPRPTHRDTHQSNEG